jgi:replicative DNA helicase
MAGRTDIAILDYVQDIAPSGSELRLPRPEFVGKCSQALKDLSAEVKIPIVLFGQASKPTLKDAKANPRPGMYDAQWSSKLPQDAEEVYILYNDAAMVQEYGDAWRPVSLPGCVELIKRKARRTALGGIELTFDGNIRWLGETVPL